MEVAEIILAQLGGNKFRVMTGARNLLGSPDYLQFDLPRGFAKNKATKVRILLTPADTYTVTFYQWKPRALELAVLEEVSDVYVSDLRRIFTDRTGLDCTLGRAA